MQKKSFSWGIIMLLLFLFFPAAIVMILIKMINEKFSYLKNLNISKYFLSRAGGGTSPTKPGNRSTIVDTVLILAALR